MSVARLIVVEGLDGTGKSTLAGALARHLGAELLRTPPAELATVRSSIDAALDQSPVARQLFYAATVVLASDRARSLLAEGRSVVVDRYWFSTLAYASVRADAVDLAFMDGGLRRPDVTVYLHVDEATRWERVLTRGATPADRRSLTTGSLLASKYDALLATPFAGRVLRVDTTSASAGEVERRVCEALVRDEGKAA